ncbi:MAG: glycosyltransferase family 9 protein [Oxalobacter formigenes]|nr:glycosyltransferase family 9 protein [Oxalobacter formigenes]
MTTIYRNILVIKMSALGDIIQALPSLYMLRTLYPKARITWLTEPQFADVLPDEPYINKKIIFYKNDIKKKPFFEKLQILSSLRRELAAQHFDLVIDLQGLAKSALVSLLSGCKTRIGYCEMREGSSLVTRSIIGSHKNGHVIERYRDVIRHLGATDEKVVFPVSPSVYRNTAALRLVKESGITGHYAVFFPGTGWKTKEWPLAHFARLAEQFIQAKMPVVIAGDNRDVEKGKKITQLVHQLPGILDLTGKTRLIELFCLLKNAAVCVGGDTGPQHIAAAVGTPTVSLFGPSSWSRSYPMRSRNSNKPDAVICATVPCSPCFKRNCPKNIICMDTIGVEAVFEACKQYILPDKNKTLPQSGNSHLFMLPCKEAYSTDIQAAQYCSA